MSADAVWMERKYRPSLRTILASLILTVLLLPLGGLVFFRIFEAHLVRETENELIGQAALIAETYKATVRAVSPDAGTYGTLLPGVAAAARFTPPVEPVTDLGRSAVLPPRPDGVPTDQLPDAVAAKAAEFLAPVFAEAQKVTLVGLRLLDHRGVAIAGGNEIGHSFAAIEEVREAMTGRYVAVLRERILRTEQPALSSLSRGTTLRIFSVYPIVDGDRLLGLVYQSRTPDNILRKLFISRDRLVLAGLSVLGLALALALVAGRTISGPINALNERARRLASGDTAALSPLDRAGTRELAALSDSFSYMATALQHRASYVRDFAAHVAHEFKTPLTSIQGATELIAEHGAAMPDEQRQTFARNILEDTERLRRLVTRLHDLARAEHAATVRSSVDVATAIRNLAGAQTTASLRVTAHAAPALVVRMSDESLDIVTANLIANAVQNGATEVTLTAIVDDADMISLTVGDNGRGVASADADRIFEPFFTTRSDQGGTGLGLRIVRAMIETYGGTIDLVPGHLVPNEAGATFRIRLRRARSM